MGMKISIALEHLKHGLIDQEYPLTSDDKFAIYETLVDVVYKWQLMQGNYENRLKADLKAMLTDLQMEIEECVDGAEGSPQFEQGVTTARVQVVEIIQQKINELKTDQEGEK